MKAVAERIGQSVCDGDGIMVVSDGVSMRIPRNLFPSLKEAIAIEEIGVIRFSAYEKLRFVQGCKFVIGGETFMLAQIAPGVFNFISLSGGDRLTDTKLENGKDIDRYFEASGTYCRRAEK